MAKNLLKLILSVVTFGGIYYLFNLFLPAEMRLAFGAACVIAAILVSISDRNWLVRWLLMVYGSVMSVATVYFARSVQAIADATWENLLSVLVMVVVFCVGTVALVRAFSQKTREV